MPSLILAIAARVLSPLLLLFSLFLLFRGHNAPGGGFAGALVAAVAVALYLLGAGLEATRRLLPAHPRTLVALGLLLAGGSGAVSLLAGEHFFEAQWLWGELPLFGGLHLGTPLLFELGIYLVTLGGMLLIVITLEEDCR